MPITDVIQQLLIVKGVAPAVGDTTSAEQGLTSVDLLAQNQQSGWSLDAENGWNPAIASLKGGGVWADSAVSSGRQLLSSEEGNVLETMQLTVSGLNVPDLSAHLSKMSKMIQDARDFWATFDQIEPVYIRWQAVGAAGPQYALIYNMEMAIVEPEDYTSTLRMITLTMEREPYWRPLAPGANPKLWTHYINAVVPTPSNLSLVTNTNHLLFQALQNRREWNVAGNAVISQNYLDIPAAMIPGDAPALVCLSTEIGGTFTTDRLMVARSTNPALMKERDGTSRQYFFNLNAGDGATGTDTTIAADTGAPFSNAAGAGRRAQVAFVTVTLVSRLAWLVNTSVESPVDLSTFRGRFAFFLRCRLSAAGTVGVQLRILGGQGTGGQLLLEQTVTDNGVGGTGNTTEWALVYLGQGTIPDDNRKIQVGTDGLGVYVPEDNNSKPTLNLDIYAERISGTPAFYMADLIMLPIGECSAIYGVDDTFVSAPNTLYDNTGYMGHGQLDDTVFCENLNESSLNGVVLQGQSLTLIPGIPNRLFFHSYRESTRRSMISDTITARLNIVPRWRGIRDV